MKRLKHKNDGRCLKCLEIINRYPNFNRQLLEWFLDFQGDHPEFHVSCAGRGRLEQEEKKAEGKSRAGWLESGHNWNISLDLFINGDGHELYDRDWFDAVLAPIVPSWMTWYGSPGSPFAEIPHVEVKHWRLLRDKGMLQPVEGDDD